MSERPPSFLTELKRRKVPRVAIMYVAAVYAVLQAADIVMPHLDGLRRLPSNRRDPRFVAGVEKMGLPAYWDETSWPEACARTGSGGIECH